MTRKKLEDLVDSPTFCTYAWTGLSISPSGAVTPCCLYEESIKDGLKPVRIYEGEIPEFYNNEFMKDIRRKMLNGEKVEGCRQCYENEKHGGVSLRLRANHDHWELKEEYDLEEKLVPQSFDLKLNNKCNLKCRMCQPRDSHQIYEEFKGVLNENQDFRFFQNSRLLDPELKIDLNDVPNWEDEDQFYEKIKKALPSMRKLSIVGGEPLILESLYRLLDLIVEEGHADHIFLAITTNLMTLKRERIKKYFNHFEQVLILISLDAVGHELNYIRYPSDFGKIEKNFEFLYKNSEDLESVLFCFALTAQIYNAIYIADIFYFIERVLEKGIKLDDPAVSFTYLTFPEHLNIRNLPEGLRKLALAKLTIFLKDSVHLKKQPVFMKGMQQLIGTLKEKPKEDHRKNLSEFLYYTDVLDKTRNQSFEQSLPEVYNELARIGIKAKKPEPNYHMLREEGWSLAEKGKLLEAGQMFNEALKTSKNKDLDYRELGWIYMDLGKKIKSFIVYRKAFKLNPNDPYIARGYTIASYILRLKPIVRKVFPHANKLNPNDEVLNKIKAKLRL